MKLKKFKPAKENLILQEDTLAEELTILREKFEDETDPEKKAKLALEIKAKEIKFGSVVHKSLHG